LAAAKKAPAVVGSFNVSDRDLAKKYGIITIDDTKKIIHFIEKPDNPYFHDR
jgi:ADP-glucose pyrophosphorylase